jgi:hypothetical protein
MFISRSLCFVMDWSGVFALPDSNSLAHLRNSGSREFDEMHGGQKVLRQRRDGGIRIAPEHGTHDRGVFGFARRRSSTAEVRVLGPPLPCTSKPTAMLSTTGNVTGRKTIVNRKSIFCRFPGLESGTTILR